MTSVVFSTLCKSAAHAAATIVGAGLLVGCASYSATIEEDFQPAPFSVSEKQLVAELGAPTNTLKLPNSDAVVRHCFAAPSGSDRGERCFTFVDGKLHTRVSKHLRFAKEALGTYEEFVTDATARHGNPAGRAQFASAAKNCTYITDSVDSGRPDDEKATTLKSVNSVEASVALKDESLCARTDYGQDKFRRASVVVMPSKLHPGMYLVNYLQFTPDEALQRRHAQARMDSLKAMGKKLDALMEKVKEL